MTGVVRTATLSPASRALGFSMAVALVMGNMIGSGIFLLPASLAPYGVVGLIGWFVSTAGALALAMVFARLSAHGPSAGGPYAYTRRAFGELAGFLVAWGYWIAIWTALGALAVALIGYLTTIIPGLAQDQVAAAVACITVVWVLVGVNILGIRTAGWVQLITTVLKLLPLAAVAIGGIARFDASQFVLGPDTAGSWMTAVPAVTTLTLWAFTGLESATIPAANISNPGRTIPRATLVGTVATAAVYVVSTVGVMSLVRSDRLAVSSAPFADAARALGGEWAALAIAAGAVVSCAGALNGWTLLAGQLPLAVARDGLFPPIFAKVTARETPAAALVIAGVLTTILVSLNYARGLVELFTFFILLSTLNTLVPYVFSSLAVFLLKEPSQRPLTIGGAFVAGLAFVYSVWAIGGAGPQTVYYGFLLLLSGLPVYVYMVRRRVNSQPPIPNSQFPTSNSQ